MPARAIRTCVKAAHGPYHLPHVSLVLHAAHPDMRAEGSSQEEVALFLDCGLGEVHQLLLACSAHWCWVMGAKGFARPLLMLGTCFVLACLAGLASWESLLGLSGMDAHAECIPTPAGKRSAFRAHQYRQSLPRLGCDCQDMAMPKKSVVGRFRIRLAGDCSRLPNSRAAGKLKLSLQQRPQQLFPMILRWSTAFSWSAEPATSASSAWPWLLVKSSHASPSAAALLRPSGLSPPQELP